VYEGELLLNEILVSYISDGNVVYAQRLLVSGSSPSGRFTIVKACEEITNESGLCWAVFLIDRQDQQAQKIGIAKYGGQEWVQWSNDERYAVFTESMEGSTWFLVLDLQSGETKTIDDYTLAIADLDSFR
jgi:Tol biopolymer transport system component